MHVASLPSSSRAALPDQDVRDVPLKDLPGLHVEDQAFTGRREKRWAINGSAIRQGGRGGTVIAELQFVVSVTATTALTYSGSVDSPAFLTAAGEGLVLNVQAGQILKGHLAYILVW